MQTDNSYFQAKVQLRLDNLPDKPKIRVLDAYHGNGTIWREIARQRPDIMFRVVGIDVKTDRRGLYMVGDNRKFMAGMDLTAFDVIDLDAYGAPIEQLDIVLNAHLPGTVVFVTWCRNNMGNVQLTLAKRLGYTWKMIRKIPTLFCRRWLDNLLDYLALRGIGHIKLYQDASGRKNYLCFRIKN